MSSTPTIESVEDVGGTVRSAIEGLRERASVSSVYGDPIEFEEKTIIPVARIGYGFGGGFGTGGSDEGEESDDEASESRSGSGGGGGGGMGATPVGVVEITDHETRFVRFDDRRRLGLAVLAGLALGFLFGRR